MHGPAAAKILEEMTAHDLTILARSDVCFRFPGDSTGADREVVFAKERGIPVFTEYGELMSWLMERQ